MIISHLILMGEAISITPLYHIPRILPKVVICRLTKNMKLNK